MNSKNIKKKNKTTLYLDTIDMNYVNINQRCERSVKNTLKIALNTSIFFNRIPPLLIRLYYVF